MKMPKEIKALFDQYIEGELALQSNELVTLSAYLMSNPISDAYNIAYKLATKAERIELRKKTDALIAEHAKTAVENNAKRKAFILGVIQILIQSAASAVIADVNN
jgi:hypothetical protein